MSWKDLERHFSPARLGRYSGHRKGDTNRAAADYSHNVLLAEAMMPLLNVLEISLRNAIHRQLQVQYQRPDWWAAWAGDPAFSYQNRQIVDATTKLGRRRELQHPDKVVAELMEYVAQLVDGKPRRLGYPVDFRHLRLHHFGGVQGIAHPSQVADERPCLPNPGAQDLLIIPSTHNDTSSKPRY